MTAPVPAQVLVEHGLRVSKSDDCVVIVREGSHANLRWANNTLTTNGVTRSTAVTVIAFAHLDSGIAAASVSGSATTLDQVSALVVAADAAARAGSPAEDAAELVGGRLDPAWDSPPEETDISVYADLAPGLGEAFGRANAGGRILYGFVEHQLETTYLGSSTGLRRRHVQPAGHVSCTAKTTDLGHSAWVGRATEDFTDVDPLEIDSTLATRLRWGKRTLDLPAGRYDTILPPEAVADLMIYALATATARDAHDGQSVYGRVGGGTRIGERLARPGVRLHSDPVLPGLPAAPFVIAPASSHTSSVFDNGLSLAATDWIHDGVLTSLLQTRHTAALTGQPATPLIGNLLVETGGSGTLEEVVRNTERGLLLTCLWYIRVVDPQSLLLTGLTRDGVYLVENGEVTGEVNNFRFNESPVDLLDRFSASSLPVAAFSREWGEYFPWVSTPALRVPDFNMSSVSQAK
jgi:predicted Zn-dependent protease